MMFRTIDYARKPPLPVWLAPGMVLLLAAIAWGAYLCVLAERDLGRSRTQLMAQKQALLRQAAVPVQPAPTPSADRVKALNAAIAALNVPWPALLGAIESARPSSVALTRIEPRPKDQLVLITAQADDMALLLGFMHQVSLTAPFTKVLPVRQEVVAEAAGGRKQAIFEARWENLP